MSRIDKDKIDALQHDLKVKKVFTLNTLVSSLNCSVPTARLKIKRWGAYTSYNQNGRYYTLPSVPRFDHHGLWCYDSICFSRIGNLKKTLVYLIQEAPAGLTGQEIGQLIRLPPRSFLHHFKATPGIRREKLSGVYIYFSDVDDRYHVQLAGRLQALAEKQATLQDVEVVMVLSALIRHWGISAEEISALPEIKTAGISPQAISSFLAEQGLQKKTPDTRP